MKTSQSFIYDKSRNIEFITKEEFINQFSNLYKEQLVDTLSYSAIIKKYEKNFTQLSKGIYKVNKLQNDKAIICLINKTIEDFEKVYKKEEQKLTIPSKYDIIKNYQPKETKEKLKMKNKKLIKRIAVASLACFLAIPTINTVPTQAETLVTVEMLQQEIKENEKALKTCDEQDKQNYLISIQNLKDTIKEIQEGKVIYRMTVEESKQLSEERARQQAIQAAQKAAEQAEKDRIANTVYKIEVDNVLDFVPHFEGSDTLFAETYKYERADMPGVIFTLKCCKTAAGYWAISDIDPHFTIENVRNYTIKRYEDATSKNIEYDSIQDFTFNYLSPFNGIIPLTTGNFQADVGDDYRLKTYTGGQTSCQKGWNSFKVHSFYKLVKEDGTVVRNAPFPINSSKSAEEITNYLNSVKGGTMHVAFTTNPLQKDELARSKAAAENWVKSWDERGINPIIEIIEN